MPHSNSRIKLILTLLLFPFLLFAQIEISSSTICFDDSPCWAGHDSTWIIFNEKEFSSILNISLNYDHFEKELNELTTLERKAIYFICKSVLDSFFQKHILHKGVRKYYYHPEYGNINQYFKFDIPIELPVVCITPNIFNRKNDKPHILNSLQSLIVTEDSSIYVAIKDILIRHDFGSEMTTPPSLYDAITILPERISIYILINTKQ